MLTLESLSFQEGSSYLKLCFVPVSLEELGGGAGQTNWGNCEYGEGGATAEEKAQPSTQLPVLKPFLFTRVAPTPSLPSPIPG